MPANALPDEQKAIKAFSGKYVYQASTIELTQMFVYLYNLVGVGVDRMPDPLQENFLINHLKENYGGFTLDEIRLGFSMAAAGKLNVDTEHYGQFSAVYLSRIINAYKSWAAEVRRQHEQGKPIQTKVDITVDQWREQIQMQYELFPDKTNYKLWPVELYDQLVLDGFIQPGWHGKYLKEAKNILCGEVHKSIAQEKDDVKINSFEKLLTSYRSGAREFEILLLAKQMSVKELFEFGKTVDSKGFYEKAEQ